MGIWVPQYGTSGAVFHRRALPERPHERLPRRLPPPESALVSFHPTHLIKHPNEVGVANFNPSLDERPSALHRPIEEFNQGVAILGAESIGVSDEPKTGGKILRLARQQRSQQRA